ncbi:MAG: cytochrome P450, partial [Streptosporangiales bacterium]|nr:cytochrome P450 [Streptosporangiales bacterium]
PESHAGAVRMYGPEFAADPAAFYRETRAARGPVTPVLLVDDVPAWLVLSYREVRYVCDNPRIFSRNGAHWNLWPRIPPDWPLLPPLVPMPSVLHAEGADHRRRAGALSDVTESLNGVDIARICERTADQLIDEFAGDGEADLIAQYTVRMVPMVLSRLIGIPEDRMDDLNRDAIVASTSNPVAIEAALRAAGKLGVYVAEQRENPGAGLAAKLIAHPAGLTDEEARLDLLIFGGAGQQPTINWLGAALRLMLIDDGFSLSLQGGRTSVEQVLNQVLWEDPPIQNQVGRWARYDVELGGHRIGKGDFIVLGLAAANADPAARPDSLTASGGNRAHLAYAHGEHSCPVAARELASQIVTLGVEILLDRIPDVRLSVPAEELRWTESTWLRSLESLPVSFAPAAGSPASA